MPAASWRMNPARTSSWWLATVASAGFSFRVGTNDFDIRMQNTSALALELSVHRLLELLVRHGAVDEDAVDEEGGRAAHAGRLAVLLVRAHHRCLFAAVEALVELALVEADVLGERLEIFDRQLLLVAEHLVVHLPELALVLGASRRLRRLLRVGMEGEREVAEDQPHLAVIVLHQLLDGGKDAAAERALEVAELDDGHGGVVRAARGALGGDLDTGKIRRRKRDLHAVLLLQLVQVSGQLFPAFLLLHELHEPVVDLLVGLSAHFALVLLVELLELRLGRRGERLEEVCLVPLVDRLPLGLRLLLQQPLGDHLVDGAAARVVEIGERLDLGLLELSARLLVHLGIGDRLPVDGSHLFGRLDADGVLVRRVPRGPGLAGRDSENAEEGDPSERPGLLHDNAPFGGPRTLRRAPYRRQRKEGVTAPRARIPFWEAESRDIFPREAAGGALPSPAGQGCQARVAFLEP